MTNCTKFQNKTRYREHIHITHNEGKAKYCHVLGVCVTTDGVWIGESDLVTTYTTWLVTTSNYSATADLHNSQITTASAKPFPACCVFTIRSLATASNSGDSSASRAQVLPSPTPVQNHPPAVPSGTRITLLITFRHEPHENYRFHCYSPTIHLLLLW
jgi:hypothetical protein